MINVLFQILNPTKKKNNNTFDNSMFMCVGFYFIFLFKVVLKLEISSILWVTVNTILKKKIECEQREQNKNEKKERKTESLVYKSLWCELICVFMDILNGDLNAYKNSSTIVWYARLQQQQQKKNHFVTATTTKILCNCRTSEFISIKNLSQIRCHSKQSRPRKSRVKKDEKKTMKRTNRNSHTHTHTTTVNQQINRRKQKNLRATHLM